MRIDVPGYYDIPMADYLADPCPEPALSTSVVEALLEQTPSHARKASPLLTKRPDEPTARGDLGSAIHSIILGGAEVVYADYQFENWKKKAAQDFQDDAREKGQIPLLEKQRFGVEMAAEKGLKLLRESFGPGKTEQTMIFKVGGCWARGRNDYLPNDLPFDIDIKTTENADPGEWSRLTLTKSANALQAGLRSLGHIELGKPRKMVWLLIEINDPWEPSLVGMDPAYEALAHERVLHAAKRWRWCLDNKLFPGYRKDIHWASPPAYAEADFQQRKGIEQ